MNIKTTVQCQDSVAIKANNLIETIETSDEVQLNKKTILSSKTNKKNKVIIYIENSIKNIVDIIGGIVGTILLIPLTIIVFIMNKIMKEDGPIFYTQERIGKDGKIFKMYKYRTMVVGADDILKEYLAENKEAREEYKKYKKLKDDPRVTKVGNFLRKTSLDEMPQLLNVLKRDMSLVGPRPYLVREKEDMGEYYDKIIKCMPGVTGLWQIAGRSNVTFKNRLDLDIIYYNNKSLKNDIRILFNTFLKLFKKEGAI